MSASPKPSGIDPRDDKHKEKVMFRFCAECSNLLFPKEDLSNRRLLYSCRTCAYEDEATTTCVMRHEVGSAAADTAGITTDIGQDPTLPRKPMWCARCNEEVEAVYFQSQQRSAETGMKLYYVCTNPNCAYTWQEQNEKER